MEPLVSVVIPTYRRPQLVKRAVNSALAQTLSEIEVIVVIDGSHPETRAVLAEINDHRLKVIEKPINEGLCAARRTGIVAAIGEWIAHLDDDDEWMPKKLELQLATAKNSRYKYPIVSCYLFARTTEGDSIFPRREPQDLEPLSEYLFVRNSLFQGEGLIQASTIFTKRELLQKSYSKTIDRNEDWFWLLQVIREEGVGIEFVQQVLSIWHLEETHKSLSRSRIWDTSFKWIQSNRDLVTPRAYSSFILSEVSSWAAAAGDWKAFLPLLREAFQFGKPSPMDVCLCLGMWVFPPNIRRKLRSLFYLRKRLPFAS